MLRIVTNDALDLDAKPPFRAASGIDADVQPVPGVYAFRLRMGSTLPEPFAMHLAERKSRLIYIGKASSLTVRMLGNELRGRGHAHQLPLVDVPVTETSLILKHKPLLNLDGNPLALAELVELRELCRRIAAGPPLES